MPAARLEAERAQAPAGVAQPRRDDVAVADPDAVAQHLLEHHLDDVAGLQVAVEVDVAAEQLADADRQADVLAGALERRHQRRVVAIDVAADGDQRDLAPIGHDLGDEAARRRCGLDLQEPVGIDAVGQLAEPAVRTKRQGVGLMGPELARAERRLDDVEERPAILERHLVPRQDLAERVARADRALEAPSVVRQHDVLDVAGRRRGLAAGSGSKGQKRRGQAQNRGTSHRSGGV